MDRIRKVILGLGLRVIRLMLRFRYKIEVRGEEVLQDPRLQGKGVLVLPNHSSEVEPFITMVLLGSKFDLRPLIAEDFYYYPLARTLMKFVRAKPVADFGKAVNDYKLKGAEKLFKDVVVDLQNGQHVLLFPSAELKTTGRERIGGRSIAHATIQEARDAEILLVRVSGLWGSRFSKVFTGGVTPDFWTEFGRGVITVFKNFLFFTPKRKVVVEFALPDEKFPKFGTRREFNTALETFYNQFLTESGERVLEEPLNLVPYHFLFRKIPEISMKKSNGNERYQELLVPGPVRQDIFYQVSELSGKSVKAIHETDDLVFDVGLDSLNIATLYTHLETHYEIEPGIEPGDLKTVQDLLAVAMHVKKGSKKADVNEAGSVNASAWPWIKRKRPEPKYCGPDKSTIIELFLLSCDRMGKHSAAADAASGVMDYKTMKRAVIILAREIEKMEGDYIGVMLPSSTAVFLLIFAIMLAGKVPVPLNWTVGPYFMDHAINLMELKVIISSDRFLKRVDNIDLGKAIEKLVLLEDIRKGLTWKDKIRGALLAKRGASKVLRAFPAHRKRENDTAVVLFTSGTTALPKAVPLTHYNILSNQMSAVECIDLNSEDVMMLPLPAFHVFGLSIGLLPLLYGVRIVFSPDPLDSSAIAKEILKWRASIIVLAPTFYSHLFRVASLSQLKSLRVFLSGAEKAPASLMEYIQKLGDVWFLEGYGLTETSPIITVNAIYTRPRGVGKVLPCVEVVVVDPESGKVMAAHQTGEVCVTGSSVFKGYYKQDNKDVFIDIGGKKYYKTGDLGYLDEENYLHLQGRLKLSFKRGGEMINVTAIDNALFNKGKEKGWIDQEVNVTPFACVPKEVAQGATKVVLFSEMDLALDQVNKALLEVGFSRLYKVNEIIKIDEIPFLKTGKVCYRKLFDILKDQSSNGVK